MTRRPGKRGTKRRVPQRRESLAARPCPAAPPRRSHNLPIQLTSFIGRERELAEIKRLLHSARLLTLTGPAGCGKTRIALQLASGLFEDYPNGVAWVGLETLADPGLVPQALASAMGVRERQGHPVTETLLDNLRSKTILLLLDNCEHVLSACAGLCDSLLRHCPTVKILTTSREGLGVVG